MSVKHLDKLFRPASVAVIGASPRPQSVGHTVMTNLLAGGFKGPVVPVNPNHSSVAGVPASPGVGDMPITPDLAVICTPPATVPGLIRALGERGTRAAVVLTAGLSALADDCGRPLDQAMLDAAAPHALRILGPNCVGLLVPECRLNASFAHAAALPGNIAFVSQSGALCTAVLDWAQARGIGFSHFVSLGNSADIDFGDVLEYLAGDPSTHAILLYIEGITAARKFMSAARAAARIKPVVAVKAGRVAEGSRAATSHTGALAGADDVYDAALRRAGIVRVLDMEELFDATETLARARPLQGERLAILTNGGGPGVLATDMLVMGGGRLAELASETIQRLDAVLPPTWSRGNPVDIIGDAPGQRYADALDILLAAAEIDALLFIHAPTAIVDSTAIAENIIGKVRDADLPVFASWLGAAAVAEARRIFEDAGIPDYETPGKAARAFLHLVEHRRNQEFLARTPQPAAPAPTPDSDAARSVIRNALEAGRTILTEPEAKAVLAAYGVPVVETRVASSATAAVRLANELGFPVAVKILSPDLTHKTDVGGVALDIETPDGVTAAVTAITRRLAELSPGARLDGFTVQKMARRPRAHELIVGAATDPTFGPIILFGQGGVAVEVIGDRAVGLPPLTMIMARELVSRTRVSRLLAGYRDRPAADLDAVCAVIMRVSQLVSDIGEIVELDINPLLADETGVIALDARIRVETAPADGAGRLCIDV